MPEVLSAATGIHPGDKQDVTKICILSHGSLSNTKTLMHFLSAGSENERIQGPREASVRQHIPGKRTSEEQYQHVDTTPK